MFWIYFLIQNSNYSFFTIHHLLVWGSQVYSDAFDDYELWYPLPTTIKLQKLNWLTLSHYPKLYYIFTWCNPAIKWSRWTHHAEKVKTQLLRFSQYNFIKSFNLSFNTGSLSFTQTSAILTLIHKGKDLARNKLQNWRPISLTNTDYKILAKCLANRVNKVIENIISEDQVGYIKGRNVSTILRTIDDLIEYWK